MAYQKYSGYQYETSPRKLKPDYEPIKEPYRQKKSSTISEKAKKTNAKNDIKRKIKIGMYVAIAFIILFAISYRNSLITESFNEKEELKKNLSSIEKENEQLKVNIEKSLNLNNVEQSAKELLGMQKLNNNQKVYVSFPKKDYIEPATEEIIIEENLTLWDRIIKIFKK